MGINVSGEKAKLWINERESNNGNKWKQYRISVSGKYDEKWVNTYLKARFTKDVDVSNVSNGAVFNFNGFISCDKPWTNKDGKEVKEPVIVITEADFGEFGETGFAEVNERVPF